MQYDESVSSSTHRWIVRGIFVFALLLFGGVGYLVLYRNWQNTEYEAQFTRAGQLVKGGNAEQGLAEYRSLAERIPGKPAGIRAAREEQWLTTYVSDARALRMSADVLRKDGKFEQAIPIYRQVQQKYPLSRAASLSLEAESACRNQMCKDALEQAQKAARTKQWRAVLALAQRMLAVDPNFAPGREAQVDAQANIDRFDGLMRQARTAASGGDWAGARAASEKALEVIPGDSAAFDGLVTALKNLPIPAGMALILPGSFTVGADDGATDEKPARSLDSPGFYMDIAEVTNAQYARFVAATGRKRPPHWGARGPAPAQENWPVTCVSWQDAAAYAAWVGKRLPTEVEWERAARGREGRMYPWGNGFTGTEAVFSRSPCAAGETADRTDEGCVNLGGNVSEWVAFVREPPPPPPEVKPETVPRPVRGGSWAGVETGRPVRVVPERIADKDSDPTRVILTGLPGVFLELQAAVEDEFFFRGMSNDVAVFEIRRWFPQYGRLVNCSVMVREGQPIVGSRMIPSGPSTASESVHVTLDTGCRLVRVLYVDNQRPKVIYADHAGQEHEMTISSRPDLEQPRGPGAADGMRRGQGEFNKVLRELMAQALSRTARASSRYTAPGDMMFCNVGFRCAKDLP